MPLSEDCVISNVFHSVDLIDATWLLNETATWHYFSSVMSCSCYFTFILCRLQPLRSMDDTLELPPGLRAPPGWNEAHWVRLHLPPSSRPMSDEQWRKYVSIVSGCDSGEMDMPTYGYSSRVFVFFSDPYYGRFDPPTFITSKWKT